MHPVEPPLAPVTYGSLQGVHSRSIVVVRSAGRPVGLVDWST
jgi:hypothetical protein